MSDLRIAVLTCRYAMEASPTIKGMSSYLNSKNIKVDIITDTPVGQKSFKLPGVNIMLLCPYWLKASDKKLVSILKIPPVINRGLLYLYHRVFSKVEKTIVLRNLRRLVRDYDFVFCIDFHPLNMLSLVNYPLSQVVYFSLELDQIIAEYNKDRARELIAKCSFCAIQSKERGTALKNYLGTELDFEYFPVSQRPVPKRIDLKNTNGVPKIVYSGYFADWACLREFLNCFGQLEPPDRLQLVLQGHYYGTEYYLNEILSMAKKMSNVSIDTSFYKDDAHFALLSKCDIGLALYKRPNENLNWENLLFSSGKISSYLWAGLAVLTNLKCPETQHPPFLYVEAITVKDIEKCMKDYLQRKRAISRKSVCVRSTVLQS